MPRKPLRDKRRTPTGLIVMSVLVIGSLTLSAVISLVDPGQLPPPTPTLEFFVTILAPSDLTPTATPTEPPAPEPPTPGPAMAPTPGG